MTLTTGQPIVLTLTESEADLLQHALCQYSGPYRSDDVLNDAELARASTMIDQARVMARGLQDELMRRYYESQGQWMGDAKQTQPAFDQCADYGTYAG